MKTNTYSIVFYHGMKELGVNHAEYCFLHYIYSLSTKTNTKICYATKATIAKTICVSERTINEYIKKFYPILINKNSARNLRANSTLIKHFRDYEISAFEQRKFRVNSTQNLRKTHAVSADNNKRITIKDKKSNNILETLKNFNFDSEKNDLLVLNDMASKVDSDTIICNRIKEVFTAFSGRPDQKLYLNTKYLINCIQKQ